MTAEHAFRPPTAYVHGLDGLVVVVPARVAAWLDRYAGVAQLRIEHRGADPDVDSVLVALGVAALAWRNRHGLPADVGSDPRNGAEVDAASPLTATQAAGLLGLSARGVRLACEQGRLRAHLDAGLWRIHREDLEHFRAGRRA